MTTDNKTKAEELANQVARVMTDILLMPSYYDLRSDTRAVFSSELSLIDEVLAGDSTGGSELAVYSVAKFVTDVIDKMGELSLDVTAAGLDAMADDLFESVGESPVMTLDDFESSFVSCESDV